MRIAIVSSMFPPIQSGSSHYAARIAKGLSELGHDVLVISSRVGQFDTLGNYKHVTIPTVMIPSTPLSHGYRLPYCFYPLSIPLANALLGKFKPDIIHANGHFLNTSWMAANSAKHLRVPIVLTVHTKLLHTNSVLNALMRYTDRSILRRIWSKIDAAISLDRQMRYYIMKSLNISLERIHPIPLAIDLKRFLSYPVDNGDFIKSITSNRVILSISHLTRLKSAVTLLKAFKVISDEMKDVDLVFIGKIHDQTPIDLAAKLGISSRIHFLGEVQHKLIPSFLKHAVLEAHSLDSRTGFDNVCIESMAMGVPVISCVASNNFDRPWLVDSENVLLVKPRNVNDTVNAMRLVLDDKKLASAISSNAKKTARECFSIERLLTDLEKLYSSLLSAKDAL